MTRERGYGHVLIRKQGGGTEKRVFGGSMHMTDAALKNIRLEKKLVHAEDELDLELKQNLKGIHKRKLSLRKMLDKSFKDAVTANHFHKNTNIQSNMQNDRLFKRTMKISDYEPSFSATQASSLTDLSINHSKGKDVRRETHRQNKPLLRRRSSSCSDLIEMLERSDNKRVQTSKSEPQSQLFARRCDKLGQRIIQQENCVGDDDVFTNGFDITDLDILADKRKTPRNFQRQLSKSYNDLTQIPDTSQMAEANSFDDLLNAVQSKLVLYDQQLCKSVEVLIQEDNEIDATIGGRSIDKENDDQKPTYSSPNKTSNLLTNRQQRQRPHTASGHS